MDMMLPFLKFQNLLRKSRNFAETFCRNSVASFMVSPQPAKRSFTAPDPTGPGGWPLGWLSCDAAREKASVDETRAGRADRSGILIRKLKQIKTKTRRKMKRNLGLSSFIFHRKLRFCSIFLKFSKNAAFWENPEKIW